MMKFKVLFLIVTIGLLSFIANAQRGVRIGYIDTEYILQNVPEYQEASSQLEKKVQGWKTEIETKLNAIAQKKKELDNESVLLTKELYEERFDDIAFEEAEILAYQQERFGPEGDLMIQKRQLIEPIQDQIFAAVQEIAETKKYDFVFDKSADVVMLYSAERFDMSEQVLRTITRTSRRSQAKNKKERKELEDEEVVPVVSADKDDRQKALEDRKAKREEELAAKRAEREAAAEAQRKAREELRETKKREAEERRASAIAARNKPAGDNDATDATDTKDDKAINEKANVVNSERAKRAKAAEDRKKAEAELRARKKQDAEARRAKALAARNKRSNPPNANIKTADNDTLTKAVGGVKGDSLNVKNSIKKDSTVAKKPKSAAEIAEAARLQKLKEREARKKALEDRKKKILEERKKAREEREKQIKRLDSIAKAKKNNDNN